MGAILVMPFYSAAFEEDAVGMNFRVPIRLVAWDHGSLG
jgi:hypothetical protein